jgi:hypothetical protein
MSKLFVTHSFVKKLSSNIRASYGKDVRHTQVIELIADALGRQAGPMMHALKQEKAHKEDHGQNQILRHPSTGVASLDGLVQALHANSPDASQVFTSLIEQPDVLNELLTRLSANEAGASRPRSLLTVEDWIGTHGLAVDAVETAFSDQLGPRWDGLRAASLCGSAVLIVLALADLRTKTAGGADAFAEELDSLNRATNSDELTKLMLSLRSRYERDRWISRVIQKVGRKHAYENTVIHAMAYRLINHGIGFCPDDLQFVKCVDHDMWYGILNVARRRAYVGGAGIVAHFRAEQIIGKPIIEPWVIPAADGLDEYQQRLAG